MGGSTEIDANPHDARDASLAICLVSGGMDSCVTAAIAREENEELAFLHVSYGQRTEARERQAFDNLAKRCGHSGVKAVATALNQAEKYGTPLGAALRVTATENREMRMQEAERKAASLPAKLTVPMIIFFLPCLFVVIMGPAILTIKKMM